MPESSASPTSSAPAKRACDACHRRKVKCIGDGSSPCKNCASAGLQCTYNAVPQKKGPKGSRAKVISELRETQQRSPPALFGTQGYSGASSPSFALRTPGLLTAETVTACVEFFFQHIYSTQPILHRIRVQEAVMAADQSNEAYCFVCALCAFVMIQPNIVLPDISSDSPTRSPISATGLGTMLLEEAVRVRKGLNYMETPNIVSVIISFYLFGSYYSLDQQNTAWYHLREATTLSLAIGIDHEDSYAVGDPVDNACKRRLFWLLFVTERVYAIHKHRPLTLHATIELPTVEDDPQETVELTGFCHLIELFKPFDDTFIGLWNKTTTGCTSTWVAQLQIQLSEALPAYLRSTETQAVDLRTSQQWLRTMVWQLSISQRFVFTGAPENAMTFKYPIEISRDIISAMGQFSRQAIEVHGVGLIEKIFDIACTLTDVMAIVPIEPNAFEAGPRDYLEQLVSIISRLRGGQQRFLPLLISKIHETIPDMAPSIVTQISSLPVGATPSISRSSSSSHSATPSAFSTPPISAAHPAYSDIMGSAGDFTMRTPMTTSTSFGTISPTAPPGQRHGGHPYGDRGRYP
ncbi:MAG: hypothetical protein M1820_008870 [Bogoriella megaspora]|nr:MAG: hypothetical protein M1820_008870 [Bogoriella megaspora]